MAGLESVTPCIWMSQVPEKLRDTPLTAIAIPGSHNSFSSRLDQSSEISPEVSPLLQMLGPLGKVAVYKWSVTQNLDFQNQLLSGIRYFDLRVASRRGSQDIHFVHGLYGTTVEEGVTEILAFLESNKKEIVILDFNHLYKMNDDQHRIFLNMLVEKCGDKLCLFVGLENLTLNMLWENGLQIIVLYHHKVAEEFIQIWPGFTCIKSVWADTKHVSELMKCLDSASTTPRGNHFHVCQGILTPDVGTVFVNINGSLQNDLALKVMPDLMNWLKGQRRGACGINIVTADFVELDDFAKSVINMNFL